jgi:hypothetical protein
MYLAAERPIQSPLSYTTEILLGLFPAVTGLCADRRQHSWALTEDHEALTADGIGGPGGDALTRYRGGADQPSQRLSCASSACICASIAARYLACSARYRPRAVESCCAENCLLTSLDSDCAARCRSRPFASNRLRTTWRLILLCSFGVGHKGGYGKREHDSLSRGVARTARCHAQGLTHLTGTRTRPQSSPGVIFSRPFG